MRFIITTAIIYGLLAATEHIANTLPPTIENLDPTALATYLTRALLILTNL